MDNNFQISIVIPFRGEIGLLRPLIKSIYHQTLSPVEIVIINSYSNENLGETINKYLNKSSIVYHFEKNAYPGKARNIGVRVAKCEWIAFLDLKTIPAKDWLERYCFILDNCHCDMIFGVTKYEAKSSFQKTLRASTYGKIGHHTVPGTIIKKKVFIDSDGFLEHVRMAEDIEWRNRLTKKGINIFRPENPLILYTGLPNNFFMTVKKYLISGYHTARLNILRNVKDAYLTLLLILSAIVLPKWNHLIGGWDTNPLFIPHITKIFLIALVVLFLVYQLVHYLFFRNIFRTLFSRTLWLMLLVFITIVVYRWNAVIAGWVEDAVLYVPHITKMYVGSVILFSILYRGILLPLKREVEPGFLFPIRWIQVGLLGLTLDLIKAPGYVLGSVIGTFLGFRRKKP